MDSELEHRSLDTNSALRRDLSDHYPRTLAALFERYGSLVYGLALKLLKHPQEAEDLTQEIFLTVWRKARQNPDAPFLVSHLITLTRSRAIDRLRARSRALKMLSKLGSLSTAEAKPPTPLDQAVSRERSHRVREALSQLPDKQRQLLELAYDQGLSQSQIAERLNLPLGTVKTWTRQGLLQLRRTLAPHLSTE